MIELVSGASFERYQREHILAPLGMTGSAWRLKDAPRGLNEDDYLMPLAIPLLLFRANAL